MIRCCRSIGVVAGFVAFIALLPVKAANSTDSCINNPIHRLEVGRLIVIQKYTEYVRLVLRGGQTVEVSDDAGFYWPPINIDQGGYFYVGSKTIDSTTGAIVAVNPDRNSIVLGRHYVVAPDDARNALKIEHGGRECIVGVERLGLSSSDGRPSDVLRGVVRFVDADGPLVGFVKLGEGKEGNARYQAIRISPDTCHVDIVDLGNPDLLVEIGWTPGGHWWITGATEGTLIRSNDGKNWVSSSLPSEISQLVSAHVVDKDRIWLAANDSRSRGVDDAQIIYSGNGGKTWIPVTQSGKLVSGVPKFWLEGQMRLRSRSIPE